ncbi:ribosome maturation factor RimP [Rhizobium sp. TRM95796]|uniref:ribosome maturation factor RimP n=1 Tax=Rhizobium sp. TRM95796 TaxID=2979862 RepID=UPI0021E7A2DD|nr:ribosome maturation factor RimP [Rhizobium sp. TRM95796]MCV3766894.1 ribosome maturation factor RimP [Rhizobium sp. TRM95796]
MNDTVIEPRLIVETGIDARVAQIIEPVIMELGYQLVRVKLSNQNGLTLQVMAERPDGTMTVNDCEAISMAISPVLDVEDPIDKQYNLEISSPGIDRPMVRKGDFQKWQGHIIKCETSVMVEGRKRFKGKILDVNDDGFVLERDQIGYGEEPQVAIPFASLAEGRLILTDDLIRDALKADKAARAAANQNDADDEDMEDEG